MELELDCLDTNYFFSRDSGVDRSQISKIALVATLGIAAIYWVSRQLSSCLDSFKEAISLNVETPQPSEDRSATAESILAGRKIGPLNVKEVCPQECQQLMKILDVFEQNTSARLDEDDQATPKDHLQASLWINGQIYRCLKFLQEHPDLCHEKIYCCRDAQDQVQGFMVLDPNRGNHVYVNYLYTNPDNLLHSPRRTPGVGTRLIEEAAHVALANHVDTIRLCALDNARPFYERIGFQNSGGSSYVKNLNRRIADQFNQTVATAA